MFSHVTLGVADVAQAHTFYAPMMAALNVEPKFHEAGIMAGWQPPGAPHTLFVICQPFNDQPASAGNGTMVAFDAQARAQVDACHALALGNGGSCEGPPGLRPQYHANYYGAYFRDLDGNKICVCCHNPE
ncbi:MAG: VOC family protein [Hyphomicrobiaceae bacterium]